ncbi:MAG: tRNA pseudouridine(55) synthase TruB [Syntrophomonadaceae bacterium]|nr:tRNA pseudouridine(55) synthase TruB [Syntrophomonadaceae bacterium]
MNGFLNIDKPSGITSYDVIRRLKPFLPQTRIGHLGTLDPIATGVLPIAIGHATRLIGYIRDNTKEYLAEMVLGSISDTQDRTGRITTISREPVSETNISKALEGMVGEIEQIPPMYSAIRHRGRRLYELARQGMAVPVKPRLVTVYCLELQEVVQEHEQQMVRFRIGCSSGTYVRTICHDVGQTLGCGAYLNSLTRLRSGPFKIAEACGLDYLVDNPGELRTRLLPSDYPLQDIPMVVLEPQQIWSVANGSPVLWPRAKDNELYRLYDRKGHLLAVARGQTNENGQMLQPEKVLTRGLK